MKDIVEAIDSRIKSPLFGYYILAFAALNWRPAFYLIVDSGPVIERIQYFQDNTNFLSLFFLPLLVTAIYSIFYPWIQYLFMYISIRPTELRNSLQAQSEHNLLIKKMELEEARSVLLRKAEEEIIGRAKRDEELQEINNNEVKAKLQKEIDELRRERDSKSNPALSEDENLPADQEEILRDITLKGGELNMKSIIETSKYDKVKTEYLLDDLQHSDHLEVVYNNVFDDYFYTLTPKSKKLMVDKGVAK